ncbi:MAG: hypothetical protein H6696_07060 [Deferribacteres bacterium]|nr:hypothetical protein [candidate division KSB1 bacterium]MCB9501681.1 hypothetical protein [Deferribacteres bacterium]
MSNKTNYNDKFAKISKNTAFDRLPVAKQEFMKELAFRFKMSQQELRQVVEIERDLAMWGEPGVQTFYQSNATQFSGAANEQKKLFLDKINQHMDALRHAEKVYSIAGSNRPKKREKSQIVQEKSEKKIYGKCPVASPKTVCCNLRTIDAVENCIFGCSYCTIQTFYTDRIIFDEELREKLQNIPIEPNRKYHFGTGQSSDSLAWGNRFDNLKILCDWAEQNPNILLEFKTKSDNVQFFIENEIPPNILCTWSLNPQIIIDNEEHFTASLENRINAARRVADKGIKVGFHFHPMIYYAGWEEAYPEIAQEITERFAPEEVLFISFGSVTFIKPVIKKIRNLGLPGKILQMPLIPDPHGKYTYSDDLKVKMFSRHYEAFAQWQEKVFFYLCMEKAEIWQRTFGRYYPTNELFEETMLTACFGKIQRYQSA